MKKIIKYIRYVFTDGVILVVIFLMMISVLVFLVVTFIPQDGHYQPIDGDYVTLPDH